jgi:diguanylate cyclase (GGDEF)-like protein/PAS domain S-box-containing protein
VLTEGVFRAVVEACPDGIVVTDPTRPDNPVVYVNPAFEQLTGYTADEVIGHNCRFMNRNDRNQSELEVLRHALSEGQSIRVRVRNYRRDGSLFTNELSVSPVRDESGAIRYFVGIQKDVSENEEFKRRLQDSQQRLKQAHHDMVQLSRHDGLTGLANRRHLDDALAHEWRRSARAGRPISALMIDVDHFKLFNDAYGHPAGDECLRRVAAALRERCRRPSDVVGRYGGEEFLVLLAGLDADQTVHMAETLREAVEELAIAHPGSSVAQRVTISVGAACVEPNATGSPEDLVRLADGALYKAKRAGRNLVIMA